MVIIFLFCDLESFCCLFNFVGNKLNCNFIRLLYIMLWINLLNFKFIGLIYDVMNKLIFFVWYFMWKNIEL